MINLHKPILIICGKKKDKVKKIVEEFKKINPNVHGIAVDLSKKNGPNKLYDQIFKKLNTVDILINNAIINKGSRFIMGKKYEDWLEEISVNMNSNILLSQKIAYKMKNRSIRGRIINLSSNAVKQNRTGQKSGSEILIQNMIEKHSKLLSDELYKYKIAVTTIRIDEYINKKKYMNNNYYTKYLTSFLGNTPEKIMPIFMYVIKAPFHEITGKIISTTQYIDIEKNTLPKIVPPHQIKINKLYKTYNFTKNIKKNENKTYIVKQNPYIMSPSINKFISNYKINNVNDISKYKPLISTIISKKIGVKSSNIVLFKNEYDCIKKIIDIFVSKYSNIITANPTWNYMNLLSLENKLKLTYIKFIIDGKSIQPEFDRILSTINSQTKMIYLSSPNITSGQHIPLEIFKDFIENVPDNIVVIIDQRFIEFSTKNNVFNPLKYFNKYKNIIIIRTFNNYYSIENLELTYIIANKNIATLIAESQIINPIDKYTEEIALNVIHDKYYNTIKQKMVNEKKRVIKLLENNKIPYLDSDTNYLLIQTKNSRIDMKLKLEEKNVILYESNDEIKGYWTLPLGKSDINDTVIDSIIYSEM